MAAVDEENQEAMVSFALTRKDVFRLNKELEEVRVRGFSTSIKITSTISRIMLFCVTPVLVLVTPWNYSSISVKVIYLVAISVLYLASAISRHHAVSAVANNPNVTDFQSVSVTPQYLSIAHENHVCTYKWRTISGIVKSRHYLYFIVTVGVHLPVPLDVFKDTSELDHFVNIAQRYIDLARPIHVEQNPDAAEVAVWPPIPVNKSVDENELRRIVETVTASRFPLDTSNTVRYSFKREPRDMKNAHWRFHLQHELVGLVTMIAFCVGMAAFLLFATGSNAAGNVLRILSCAVFGAVVAYTYSIFKNLGIRYAKGSIWTDTWTFATDFKRILMMAPTNAANYPCRDVAVVRLYWGGIYFRGSMGFSIFPKRIFGSKAEMVDFYNRLSEAVKKAKMAGA